jgi:hypothetical protein
MIQEAFVVLNFNTKMSRVKLYTIITVFSKLLRFRTQITVCTIVSQFWSGRKGQEKYCWLFTRTDNIRILSSVYVCFLPAFF